MKVRNNLLDIAKGVAIILVVLGHTIQYGSGIEYFHGGQYFSNALFKIIYSFHMPLFMLISGFLFWESVSKHTVKEIICSRITALLVPVFVWNTLAQGGIALIKFVRTGSFGITLQEFGSSYYGALWFLWAVFFCSAVILAVHRFFDDKIAVFVLIGVLSLILPNGNHTENYVYMYPFFVMGYLWNKYNVSRYMQEIDRKKRYILECFTILLFAGLLVFYENESYVYISGTSIIQENAFRQIGINLYRWIIGFAGSGTVLIVILYLKRMLPQNRIWFLLAFVGKLSLGIYIISDYYFSIISLPLTGSLSFHYGVILLEAIMIAAGSCFGTWLLMQNKVSAKLLLGGRSVKRIHNT